MCMKHVLSPLLAGCGLATARQVAGQLVGAYAELRQLDVLLASLLASLSGSGAPGSESVICSAEFSSALVGVSDMDRNAACVFRGGGT
jgi:hypothetical protein